MDTPNQASPDPYARTIDGLDARVNLLMIQVSGIATQVSSLAVQLNSLAVQVNGLVSNIDRLITRVDTLASNTDKRFEVLEAKVKCLSNVASRLSKLEVESGAIGENPAAARLEESLDVTNTTDETNS